MLKRLADDLLAARHEYRLNPLLKRLRAYDLLICDEFGYIPFSTKGAQLLFQFFAERYDRGSVLVTSNLEFARWTEILGNERMTAALLDRLPTAGMCCSSRARAIACGRACGARVASRRHQPSAAKWCIRQVAGTFRRQLAAV